MIYKLYLKNFWYWLVQIHYCMQCHLIYDLYIKTDLICRPLVTVSYVESQLQKLHLKADVLKKVFNL